MMKFIPTHWDYPNIFENNLKNLASNLFRIKFFYQEDQLTVLSQITNLEEKTKKVLEYQKKSDEVTIYLKVIAAFINENATAENDIDALAIVIDYFLYMEAKLMDEEIRNPKRYRQWLKNHEYY